MSLSGATHPNITKLALLIEENKLDEAIEAISAEREMALANEYFHIIFSRSIPQLWVTFLGNEYLNSILLPKDLLFILESTKAQLAILSIKDLLRSAWQAVVLTMIKNRSWCQAVSYAYFMSFLEHDSTLAEYMTGTASFLTHLDFYHVGKLAKMLPFYLNAILETLNCVYQADDKQGCWVTQSVKSMIKANVNVIGILEQTPGFEPLRLLLMREFERDKFFALTVLSNVGLYQLLFKRVIGAQRHPLFKDQDYLYLAEHFRLSEPNISNEYLSFCPQPFIESIIEGLNELELNGQDDEEPRTTAQTLEDLVAGIFDDPASNMTPLYVTRQAAEPFPEIDNQSIAELTERPATPGLDRFNK
ncbi:MAG: hypothetical protein JSR17_00400 [Proteobacteria bacterium]|nr:hypothetical protein [Pseudomonadota bacterium]